MSAQMNFQAQKPTKASISQTSGVLQRRCDKCRKKKKTTLQRAAIHSASESVPPIVHEVLRLPGAPLDAATRAFMEPRFGHDFSGVRVHTDEKAANSAKAADALAYTVGQNIVFGLGHYAPDRISGKKLLAHELTHVVQQMSSSTPSLRMSQNIDPIDSPLEKEADVMADLTMASSARFTGLIPSRSKAGILQRQAATGADSSLGGRSQTNFADCDSSLMEDLMEKHNAALNRGRRRHLEPLTGLGWNGPGR
jgi:hypothetical protein